jgi:hypothetical protein
MRLKFFPFPIMTKLGVFFFQQLQHSNIELYCKLATNMFQEAEEQHRKTSKPKLWKLKSILMHIIVVINGSLNDILI